MCPCYINQSLSVHPITLTLIHRKPGPSVQETHCPPKPLIFLPASTTMLPVRWRAAARANDVLRWKPVSCQRTSMLRALHTNFRPRTPSSRARVQLSLSRVPQPLPRQYASFRWKHTSHPLSQLSNSLPPQQLQSRFPTKTVIALLIIGGIFYFAPVGIEFKSSLVDRLYHVFNEDPTAMPWHLYRSPEEVDHMIEHHMFDLTDPGFRDPRFSELVSEEFSVMASGWEIQEDEARASGIPITHGCRYRSNFPCVSVLSTPLFTNSPI